MTALAREHRVDGLELRIHDDGIVSDHMDRSRREQVRASISRTGLTVLSLGSYIKVCQPGPDETVVRQLRTALELAADVGAEAVRVFPGAGTGPTTDHYGIAVTELDMRGSSRLAAAAPIAERLGLRLLLETHDSHPRGVDISRILAPFRAEDPVGAIWDVMHPWRFGEDPVQTAHQLGSHYQYVQFKDATMDRQTGNLTMTLPGAGDIPLQRILDLVVARTPTTEEPWISLEWEKAWHPELPGLPEALIAFKTLLGRPESDAALSGSPRRPGSAAGARRNGTL
ncbi:sugar phosphate isomerase/epimerase family protein [Arthrobacter sp. FB24]|uniref:sugar phosphate isomerase/epimerase family protein n=1 Tax=Arthrobacter sp. (strain FB24) TaxID=290399 RepID=UPI0018DE41C3|nr:TIM barrel protein [Arthrobacter sp. FB24]